MTHPEDAPLLSALRELVEPEDVLTPQDSPTGPVITTVTHPPLLTALEAAAVGAMGSHAGTVAAGLDSQRLPGNWAAIALRDEIRRRVGAPGPSALTAWVDHQRAAHRHGHLTERQYTAVIARVRGWADRIRALFAPPVTVPLAIRCPQCFSRWGVEPVHQDRVDAVAVQYVVDGDAVQKVWAECRALLPATDLLPEHHCAAVWDGREGVRQLMDLAHVSERLGFPWHLATDAQLADVAVVCQQPATV